MQKGVSSARSDDTKGLKGPILDWITPRAQSLNPPLSRNVKVDRGFHHERTGSLLCPAGQDWSNPECAILTFSVLNSLTLSRIKAKLRSGDMVVSGDHWPIFLYAGYIYDPEDPWKGLFKSQILISVNPPFLFVGPSILNTIVKAYKHVFTSPSSVDKEVKATRSGNARIHGMTRVTPASIAYIATQVRQQ